MTRAEYEQLREPLALPPWDAVSRIQGWLISLDREKFISMRSVTLLSAATRTSVFPDSRFLINTPEMTIGLYAQEAEFPHDSREVEQAEA